jgi:hypothetical protein
LNLGTPEWVKSAEKEGARDWDDAMAMVRDTARVEKHLYPHMKQRIYGGAWEVNLNMPPYQIQARRYTAADVVDQFRRIRAVVKAEDPKAMIIGPCGSVINVDWYETVFKAGLLDYLDGIETHGYTESVFTPEENDFPGKIARLNALVRKYKGRTLPIYCTEAGQPGILGATVVHRSQAERMVRTAIILKGEGIRVFLPFYGIDYDRSGYWGFTFNCDIDTASSPWVTKHISPKPMVNAIATCALMLEGATPKCRIRTLGDDVWAYVFDRNESTITAVWTTGKARTIMLPTFGARQVEIVDIMGHGSAASVTGGKIRVAIDGSPMYVVGKIRGKQLHSSVIDH